MDFRTTLGYNKVSSFWEEDMKYQVLFTYDAEYDGYVSEVPCLPGCFSQGQTMVEAIINIRDAIQGYLQAESSMGCKPVSSTQSVFLGEVVV
jgi:predicted RNase H-like HicB family nuclease